MTKKTTRETQQVKVTMGAIFGEIVWLMAQSRAHRNNFLLSDLEWLVMPPVTEGQFRVFHNEGKPVGAAFWAFVSPEVDKRLSKGMSKLKLADWRSGTEVWLIDIIAPYGHADEMIEELRKTLLADYNFKCFQITPEGERKVVNYQGANQ